MYLILLFYLLSVIDADRLPFGHLKPFGSSESPLTVREFSNGFPSALTFVDEHLEKSVPFLVRQVLNENVHFEMWRTDRTIENEIKNFTDEQVFVQSSRDPERIQMNFRDFLQRYIGENLFLVDNLPANLQKFLVAPRILQCPSISATLQTVILAMNRMSISPLMSGEEFHHLFCIYRGNKRFVLVDSVSHPEIVQLVGMNNRATRIHPDRVDMKQFPFLATVDYRHANLTAGDCLFIPTGWIFQERSMEPSVAVIFNFHRKRTARIQRSSVEQCSTLFDPTLTLERLDWFSKDQQSQTLKSIMINIVNSTSNHFEQWQKIFSKHLSFDVTADSETSSMFDEFYGIVDVDGDGEITFAEIEQIHGSHQSHISEILYELVNAIDERELKSSIDDDHHRHQNSKVDL